ncbi:hypothetical protein DP20_3613 [Shigella flexneri]|nr:hypothetical protein DP20_3613 [Shigella flexneri]
MGNCAWLTNVPVPCSLKAGNPGEVQLAATAKPGRSVRKQAASFMVDESLLLRFQTVCQR